VLDNDTFSTWQSGALAPEQWLQLDFGRPREYGGLVIDWSPDDYAVAYDVEVSDDAQTWNAAFRGTRGRGNRDSIFLPDGGRAMCAWPCTRAAAVRLPVARRSPLELAARPTFMEGWPGRAAGHDPLFLPPQTYGRRRNGDEKGGVREDGMLEVEARRFSIRRSLHRRHAGELAQRAAFAELRDDLRRLPIS
jgi:hypothetical protein